MNQEIARVEKKVKDLRKHTDNEVSDTVNLFHSYMPEKEAKQWTFGEIEKMVNKLDGKLSGYIDDNRENIIKLEEAITVPGLIGDHEHWQYKTIGKYVMASKDQLA